MRGCLTVVLLAAAAGPAFADACRLSTEQCSIIAREIAAEQINVLQDEQTWGYGLTPYERGQEMIKRHFARKAIRYKHIPVPLANEWSRMELCDQPEFVSDHRCR